MKIYAVFPDIHAPLHNEKAFGAACNAASDKKLSGIIQLGDFADFESLSSHTKTKPSERTLKKEVEGVVAVRKDLESLATKRVITLGNHEDRLPRFLMKNAPELFDSVDFETLCGFDKWEVIDFKQHYQLGKVILTHTIDPQMTGVNAIRNTGVLAGKSIITGHVHRLQTEYFGKVTGKHYFTHCPGWLGSDKAAEYMSKAKIWSQWQTGFDLLYVEDNGYVHLQAVAVVDGKCVVDGKVYKG